MAVIGLPQVSDRGRVAGHVLSTIIPPICTMGLRVVLRRALGAHGDIVDGLHIRVRRFQWLFVPSRLSGAATRRNRCEPILVHHRPCPGRGWRYGRSRPRRHWIRGAATRRLCPVGGCGRETRLLPHARRPRLQHGAAAARAHGSIPRDAISRARVGLRRAAGGCAPQAWGATGETRQPIAEIWLEAALGAGPVIWPRLSPTACGCRRVSAAHASSRGGRTDTLSRRHSSASMELADFLPLSFQEFLQLWPIPKGLRRHGLWA
jgi:hypothetical protein